MSEFDAAVVDKIKQVLHRYLGQSAEITLSTTAADIKQWTSLTHTKILIALEEEFELSFSNKEISQLKNVGDLIGLVHRKLGRGSHVP
jgi:acyl carrier protein